MPPPERREILGAREYADAVDVVIGRAMGFVRVFERSLGRDYNAEARCETLRAFLRAAPTNRLRIVVHDPSHMRRDCPRLVQLLRHFSHGIAIHRTLAAARNVYDAFCMADGSHYARRFHYDQPRGVLVLGDAEGAAELLRRFDEIWEVSQPAVSATTLGL